MAPVTLRRTRAVTAALGPYEWAWARENRARIEAHWARRRAARPAMFNGRVMLAHALAERNGACHAALFETDYATLTAFRDFGFPDPGIFNVFAAIVPRSADGAYLLGRMNGHTANAGQIYFACGTPDPEDVREGGRVDLGASALRELHEETGLVPPETDRGWTVVQEGGHLAFLRPMHFAEDADTLLARARAHLAAEAVPELADVVAVRGPDDIDPASMPVYAQVFLRDAFAAGGDA
ncbi:NUDIX hydrolase [Methylobacterium oryzisoli]|uniref:NUDIX hydrolase n=1 Tax=Methylobacterium oryzisoli TaxID=3385502 RepID=UPI0038915267